MSEEIKPWATYTTAEAAPLLKTTVEGIRLLVKNGDLPLARPGKSFVFLGQSLIDYLTKPTPVMAQPTQAGRRRRRRV